MKVRIYRPHTHQRVAYEPGPDGIVLEVSATDAAFLNRLGTLDPPRRAARPVVEQQPESPTSDPSDA
ncbi:hypothetical protein [Lysobacter olei]